MSVCISGLQIIQTQERPGFRSVTNRVSRSVDLNRTHVVCNNGHFAYLAFSKNTEGFECLRLSCSGISDHQDRCLLVALQKDFYHCAMEGHVPGSHHMRVMKSKNHLLQVSEIAEFLPSRHSSDKYLVFFILVEYSRKVRK